MQGQAATYIHFLNSTAKDKTYSVLACSFYNFVERGHLLLCSCLKGSLGTIVAGDFNCPPDSLEMHLFRALLPQLHDCWEQLHPQQPGFTSNSVDNSFTKPGAYMLHDCW